MIEELESSIEIFLGIASTLLDNKTRMETSRGRLSAAKQREARILSRDGL